MNGSTETRFLYEGDQLIGEYNASNQLLRRYVPGPGDEVAAWYEGAGTSDRRYLTTDRQGSVISVTNASGTVLAINSYDEAGIGAAGNLGRFQYDGEPWLSEIGLYNLQARAYSPYMGRFLQTDPIRYDGGANWYAYGGDDPVNRSDPSGLEPNDPQAAAPTPGHIDFCINNPDKCAGRSDPLSAFWRALDSAQHADRSFWQGLSGGRDDNAADYAKGVVGELVDDCAAFCAGEAGAAGGLAKTFSAAGGLIYSDRVRVRGTADPTSHNFPYSYDSEILSTQPQARPNGYKIFQKSGTMNGRTGMFEIGVNRNGVIDHRFFRPD